MRPSLVFLTPYVLNTRRPPFSVLVIVGKQNSEFFPPQKEQPNPRKGLRHRGRSASQQLFKAWPAIN